MPRLRVKCPPAVGESAMGWKLRMAETNGYRGVAALGDLDRAISRTAAGSMKGMLRLAEMNGCSPTDLERLATLETQRKGYRFPNVLIFAET